MRHALAAAKAAGHGAVILLGDAPYYARFGFSALKTGELSLPGPFERDRLLGLELREGALDGARGMILPTGPLRGRNQRTWNQGSPRQGAAAGPACRLIAECHGNQPTHHTRRPESAGPDHHHDPRDDDRGHDRPGHLRARWGSATPTPPNVTRRPQ